MGNYGLQTFNSAGALVFDSNKLSWILIDSFQVTAFSSGSKSYPQATGHTLYAKSVNVTISDGGHSVTTTGLTVTWSVITGPPLNVTRNSASNIFIFMGN